jgi:hypothetical protein
VPTIPRQQPAKLLDDDERWRLLQRCLTDTALPVDVRAAGALTLLFGLPTERIRHLTADQLSCHGKHTYLTAGRRPALLPPRLANLSKTWPRRPSRNVASRSRRPPRGTMAVPGPRAGPANRQPCLDHPAQPSWHQRSNRPQRRPPWRPICPPPSWPTFSACTSTPPSDGSKCRTRLGRLHSSPCH